MNQEFARTLRRALLQPEFPSLKPGDRIIFRSGTEVLIAEADISQGVKIRRYLLTESGWILHPPTHLYHLKQDHVPALTQHLNRLRLSRPE